MAGGPLSGILGGVIGGDQAQMGTGILGNMNSALTNNAGTLLGLGAGLLAGDNSAAMQGAMNGMQMDQRTRLLKQKEAEAAQQKLAAQQLAQKLGHPEIAGMPELVQSLALDRYKTREPARPQVFGSGETGYYALGRDGTMAQLLPGAGAKPAAPPAGYRWGQDGKSLEAIPGGPADKVAQPKEIPAEVAGRIALADEYLKNAPKIETAIQKGEMTGLYDSQMAQAGYGQRGIYYRQIQSGVDALRRGLTGAGMPEGEAKEYADRYLPQTGDNVEKLMSKHQQLANELQRFRDMAMQGRGAPGAPQSAAKGGGRLRFDAQGNPL